MPPYATNGRGSVVRDLAPRVLQMLPGSQAAIAKALARPASDRSVRRTLEYLTTEGLTERDGRVWRRCLDEADVDVAIPEDFDQESRALYTATLAHLRGHLADLWDDTVLPTLERYVRSKQLARQARQAADEAGQYVEVKGGRVFKHPGVRDARDHERDAHLYAEALLLTPASRKRHNVKDSGGGGDSLDDF